MKGKLNKFKKLLCYLIVSIFIFGIGGEIVNAQRFGTKTPSGNLLPYGPYGYNWFYPMGEYNVDAWCLNPTARAPFDVNGNAIDLVRSNASLIPQDKMNAVINVINAGNRLNLSAGEKYYITQAAIWKVIGNIPYYLDNWFESSKYSGDWNTLKNAANNKYSEPNFSINGTDYTMDVGDTYIVSKDFSISGEGINGNYNVSINAGSSAGACILYNDNCQSSVAVPAGANFKIRVDRPSDAAGTVDASFTVVPQNTQYVYNIETYVGMTSYGVQNMAIMRSVSKSLSANQSVKGNYVNNTTVEVQKTDADTGAKVAGAKLYIEDENGNRIGNYESTAAGQANPSVSLPIGKYYLGEATQPTGYYWSSEKIEFNITDVGGERKVLDKDGNEFLGGVPTISLNNKRVKIKFRKVDAQGNPMAGLKFIITSYAWTQTRDENGIWHDNGVLCAYSDANGYLTIPCNGSDDTHNVRTDGEYTLGIDFGSDHDIYKIDEYCEQDSCQKYMGPDGKSIYFNGTLDLGISGSGRSIVSFNKNIQVTRDDTNTPLITMTLINGESLKISKKDITSGKEIKGAKMRITDLSVEINQDGNLVDDGIVASWTSTDKPYVFKNVVPGHKYRLTEDRAGDGYDNIIVSNVNSIDFIMDENGHVTTYDVVTGQPITDLVGEGYELMIKNDYTHTVFSKISAVTGEEIDGAELKVCTKDAFDAAAASNGDGTTCEVFVNPVNDERVAWTSEAGKTKTVEALPAGDYYLVETSAPEGYIKQVNYRNFSVAGDGTISKVTMENHPTHLTIKKLNQVTKERVPGSTLQILNASDRSIAKDAAGNELTWVSTDSGDWEIYAIPAGKYILVEKVVPEGYQDGMIVDGLTLTEYEFAVSDIAGDKNIEVGIEVLNAPNTGLSTLNLFAIGGLMIFAGYETIKIYRRKALNN